MILKQNQPKTNAKLKSTVAKLLLGAVLALSLGLVPIPDSTNAQTPSATLSFSPNNGSYVVDSTFDVSVYLDTKGQAINTIELNINFPPDKLQLVSSSTGRSIIGIWTSLPKFNNQAGTIYLVGGVPGGITASNGLISTFTFRVRSVGNAVVKFDDTRLLLNDGQGTEIPTQNFSSNYFLTLPPDTGPSVSSPTHPDQTSWYKDSTAILNWDSGGAEQGFSYVLNDDPVDTPDAISEGTNNTVTYDNLSEGRHYFHIRTLINGQWSGTSHYALNIDPNPPAEFVIEISPDDKTTNTNPVIQFATTDTASGLSHYELRVIPLSQVAQPDSATQLFIEAQSPFVLSNLDLGKYDVIVRAYDQAGNYREVIKRLEITNAIFQFISGQGVEVKSLFLIPWFVLWIILALLLLIMIWIAHRLHLWHLILDRKHKTKELPVPIQTQMEELRQYRERYGKLGAIVLLVGSMFMFGAPVSAQESVLAPPVVTTVSAHVSDQEIFYLGGQTNVANAQVIIYLQSLESAATFSHDVTADQQGNWFYRHDGFLSPGQYLLWTQAQLGDQLSPPSAQIDMTVETTALHFGGSRISYVTLYLILVIALSFLALILLVYIIYKAYHGHHKHQAFMKHITEAEASVRRGFAVLNRDIQSELEIIKKARLGQKLSQEQEQREQQLLADLSSIEQHLSKEIWDLEEIERTGNI